MDAKISDFAIRKVVLSDFPQWLPLWEGYNAFYKRTLPAEITEITWSRFLDPNEPMHALVAEKNRQLVGLVHYLFHRNTTMISMTCYLQDLFTTEAVRNQGVGKALIESVYKQAKEVGSTRVYWQTHETNTTAMRLYDQVAEKSGFVVYRKNLG